MGTCLCDQDAKASTYAKRFGKQAAIMLFCALPREVIAAEVREPQSPIRKEVQLWSLRRGDRGSKPAMTLKYVGPINDSLQSMVIAAEVREPTYAKATVGRPQSPIRKEIQLWSLRRGDRGSKPAMTLKYVGPINDSLQSMVIAAEVREPTYAKLRRAGRDDSQG